MIKVLKSPLSHAVALLLPLLSSQTLEGSEMLKGALMISTFPPLPQHQLTMKIQASKERKWLSQGHGASVSITHD